MGVNSYAVGRRRLVAAFAGTGQDWQDRIRTMNLTVLSEALDLVARADANGHSGFVESAAEWNQVSRELGGVIPTWYIELVTTVPLIGLEIGWQEQAHEQPDDAIYWVEWLDAQNVRSEALDLHPGNSILSQGYFCVGSSSCAGDQYFISIHDGDDPPLYQIDHETNEDMEEILTKGRDLVASSLSEFFRSAKVEAKMSHQ